MATSDQESLLPLMSIPAEESERRGVIGIYGIPGSGKTTLLKQLRQTFKDDPLEFFEGSELISSVVPGGLEVFQLLTDLERSHWRQVAIKSLVEPGRRYDDDAVVVGHYMFWKEEDDFRTAVMTEADLQTYTHIIYLDVPAEIVFERRKQDSLRNRPSESAAHLREWQETEKLELRRLCYKHGILFSVIRDEPDLIGQVVRLLQHTQYPMEPRNQFYADKVLDKICEDAAGTQWSTLLVVDADKTLTPVDTGELFWRTAFKMWPSRVELNSLKEVFSSNLGYSHTAFAQVMMLYEETFSDEEYTQVCAAVAHATTVHPEFVSLLQTATQSDHTKAVIITCGLTRVWEKVLSIHGLKSKVEVVGSGRLYDGLVVTPNVKTAFVSRARSVHKKRVFAFGDSPLDLGMLREADRAIVVVGDEQNRSKSMNSALLHAIDHDGLQARQVVLPSTAAPRLSLAKLPLIELTGSELIGEIFPQEPPYPKLDLTHGTTRGAVKLLTTPMRDARLSGPALREAHRSAGRYLATESLSEVCGVQKHRIPHVQGREVYGYGILHEEQTLIVPLMRGGEPMALGVSDVMPQAMFRHANQPEDLREEHLQGRLCVILVDSVVNSGKSLLEFVRHVRKLHATIRIVAMAGVVQEGAAGKLESEVCCQLNFKLIALRLSDNKYSGRGGTDTGNRLFNTTHLD